MQLQISRMEVDQLHQTCFCSGHASETEQFLMPSRNMKEYEATTWTCTYSFSVSPARHSASLNVWITQVCTILPWLEDPSCCMHSVSCLFLSSRNCLSQPLHGSIAAMGRVQDGCDLSPACS